MNRTLQKYSWRFVLAFDGIVTMAICKEIAANITLGKIDKVYQPEPDEIVIHIHTKNGNRKLYSTVNSMAASLYFIDYNPVNPVQPLPFCMLLRKHIQGSRIVSVEQKGSERIIEISLEVLNELGFTASKKLIFEIMGKHSNIILVDTDTGKVIDSIKRISIDVNRSRQILPGKIYEYPPAQDKIPFKEISPNEVDNSGSTPKQILNKIGGISPALAQELFDSECRSIRLASMLDDVSKDKFIPRAYTDERGVPREFHITDLKAFESTCTKKTFSSLSETLFWYFGNRKSSNRVRQKSSELTKHLNSKLDKLYLKEQRLKEDLLNARNSEELRLFGELLTANMHLIKSGAKSVTVTNYYNNKDVTIPLDPRYSPNKNAQLYFKNFGKAKTAVREKNVQLKINKENIDYLESVLTFLENTDNIDEIKAIRAELEDAGFLRRRRKEKSTKKKKYRSNPHRYRTRSGLEILVGKNNRENDVLTMQTASKTDYWFHTKDIPGSHVILMTQGREPTEDEILETASIAAFYSKGRLSSNVPVDYVRVRYVKKPSGAKPGMVIFTHNRTVWVSPEDPNAVSPQD